MINKFFTKLVTVGTLFFGMTFAFSAMAGKDFFKKDFSNETTRFVQLAGQRLSVDRLVFVVHGDTRELQKVAYRVAQRLDDENIPVAFLLAPDSDGFIETISIDFYTKGGTKYNVFSGKNVDLSELEQAIDEHAHDAYNEFFLKHDPARHDFSRKLKWDPSDFSSENKRGD